MQNQDLLEQDRSIDLAPQGRSRRSNILFWVQATTFVLGLSLLIYLIYRLGYQSILESVGKVGWGFLALFALNFGRHLLRALSLYIAVDPAQRTFKYWSAAAARLGGEAVTFISFTGPFLGDATKAVLLKKQVPLKYGASAVIIDNIAYYSSVIVMVLAGIAVLIELYGPGSRTLSRVLTAIVVFACLMFLSIASMIYFQIRPFTRLIAILKPRGLLPGFIARRSQSLSHIETNVFDFYNRRRRDFFLIFATIIVVHGLSVTEVYLALRFLEISGSVATAFIIESLTKVINAVFIWFIPGTVGVYEGGNGVILGIVGYPAAVGIALALVRRGASLLSTSIGVMILLWRGASRGARHLTK